MREHRRPRDRLSKDASSHNPPERPASAAPGPGAAPSARSPTAQTGGAPPEPGPYPACDGPPEADAAGSSKGVAPAEALQSLQLEVIQLEALANAAAEAVVQLPFPPGREDRREFDRVYALVTKVADEVARLMEYGDELVAALSVDPTANRVEG